MGTAVGDFLFRWVFADFWVPLWPNIIASILVGAWVGLKLRAARRLHEELKAMHERHHAAVTSVLDPATPGGMGALLAELRDVKADVAANRAATEALAAITAKPAPRRGATEMRPTRGGKAGPG